MVTFFTEKIKKKITLNQNSFKKYKKFINKSKNMKKLKLKLLATLSLFFFLGSVCLVAQTAEKAVLQKQKVVTPTKMDRTVMTEKLQKIQELNTQEEQLLQQPMTDEVADRLEAIQTERASLQVRKTVKAEKQIAAKSNLLEKAQNLSLEYIEKGIPFRAQVKTIGGKEYIQLVKSPEQYGMNPVKE